ncbi:hypothetical protein SAMN02745124_00145 [Desulfofustis glycolicus DSM 9705]|uniref:Uncharacterized protein n=2 Tax=Desulfofustis glycolicus TaxID=51195 RepID=A0A1M5S3N4_9BACT|nr:hypothetical protein SAMN02745124_00145 [Desulfofustis glycolicus DSM 9705]
MNWMNWKMLLETRFRGVLMVLLLLIVAFVLVGCGGKVTYLYDDKDQPDRVTGMIKEGSFFESENLVAHYDAVQHQADALIGLHKSNEYKTDTEKVMGGIITAMLVEKVSLMPTPRIMADVFNNNLTGWLSLGLQAYQAIDGDLGKRSGSPNIENRDGIVIYDSIFDYGDGSNQQTYWGDYQKLDLTVSGEGTNGSVDASRPYTYDYNWTRTETRTDSPSKSDSSLF